MKWKSTPSQKQRRREVIRDRALRGLSLLPSLLTLGNLVCGFYAIVHVAAIEWEDGSPHPADSFQVAAIAIMLGMAFDMLDGRVARMTNSTSDFGAELDSLADAVTFGVAPGVMVAMLHAMGRYDNGAPFWSKMAWVFGAAYACGAVIRLARFNVSTDSHDESAHLEFKGLPSPAGAGVIATLVLLLSFLSSDRADQRLGWIDPNFVEQFSQILLNSLPFVALAAGYLMVSNFPYTHLANKYLKGRKPIEYLSAAIFLGALVALFPEICAAAAFCGFALTGPVGSFRAWMIGAPKAQESSPAHVEDVAPSVQRLPSSPDARSEPEEAKASPDPEEAEPPSAQPPLSADSAGA